LRFIVIPDPATSSTEEDSYFAKLDKLIQFLRTKIRNENKDFNVEYIKSFDVKNDDVNTSQRNIGSYNKSNLTKIWLPSPNQDNVQWVVLQLDGIAKINFIFHFEVYWIACDSWLMEELVTAIFIRCKGWGLRVTQIPEFYRSSNLQVHPYRCQPQMLFSDRYKENRKILSWKHNIIQTYILDKVDTSFPAGQWIRDQDQHTDWDTLAAFAAVRTYIKTQTATEASEQALANADRSYHLNAGTEMTIDRQISMESTTSNVSNVTSITHSSGSVTTGSPTKEKFTLTRIPLFSSALSLSLQAFRTTPASPDIRKRLLPGNMKIPQAKKADHVTLRPRTSGSRASRDVQYVHRSGFLGVRLAPNGLVCLMNPSSKTSDTSPLDRSAIVLKLQEFFRSCESIDVCVDVVDEIVSQAITRSHSDTLL
jgi:hypothetical protein